ncbi:MAG: MBOAT family O-acyltransferase, partial [bacterium]
TWWVSFGGLCSLAALFAWNKMAPPGSADVALASEGGIALIGMSYFTLKAASILIETNRRTLPPQDFLALARWLLYFPIFTSGPIEAFKHFDDQEPTIDLDRGMNGFERILIGCVRALVLSYYIGLWTAPILTDPAAASLPVLFLTMYALSVRIYFDFAGYSDIAIGLSALYGYRIQENFDNPLMQRNIAALWQRWHMTLTGWLRIYLFTPLTRTLMKRNRSWFRLSVIIGQIVTMAACGIWHDISWAFLAWGILHGAALAWTGTAARDLGRKMPPTIVTWWRESRTGYALSTAITLTIFSAINILAFADIPTSIRFYRTLLSYP